MTRKFVLLAALVGAPVAPYQVALAGHHEASSAVLHAAVIDSEGKPIGTVALEQTPNGVLISAQIENLPPGEHGFHIHATGICDPAAGFKTAGGHFAPRSNGHGVKEVLGPHAGDMPNQFADDHEQLRVHVLNPNVSLMPGFNSLRDVDGSALVIHEGADDYTSQPSGAAGKRLACAVISPPTTDAD